MTSNKIPWEGLCSAGTVLLLCLVAIWLVPTTQSAVFPYTHLTCPSPLPRWLHLLSSTRKATALEILQWSAITLAFAWCGRRATISLLVPLALGTIAAVTWATHLALGQLGLTFHGIPWN